ncbi:MAG: cobyrinate a,c-diamide synthase [Porphyromonadaceae bacterium]|nr:cobyrinate a,c-diamide synthase [Porphyromonadaceae bacterium]
MMNPKPQLLIAATSSGCGKTTFTLGLLRALRKRGVSVASFKCGPDYIDPKFHALASSPSLEELHEHTSINLDQYMMSPEHIREVYARRSDAADAVVVEGVMGLFDGATRMQGSSASLAQTLDIPVVLLVNAASSAYSVGAIIYGFAHWKSDVRIAGVVFNRVASESHYRFLVEAAEDAGVPALGYIPRTQILDVPSRHLGLSLSELERLDELPESIAGLIEQHIEVDRLLELCQCPTPQRAESPSQANSSRGLRIAVARDEAFNFIYQENILALERLGKVSYFSPIRDSKLPDADLVYLPGGYPEFYLEALVSNCAMREHIRLYAESEGKVLAECGGMMYLCRSIIDEVGTSYPMCGVLDNEATMQQMKLTLGYRRVETPSITLRGHEFHYSKLKLPDAQHSIAKQYNARGVEVPTAMYRVRNVFAGYTHLYWAEQNILDLW